MKYEPAELDWPFGDEVKTDGATKASESDLTDYSDNLPF
jgi:hypothetical protein